MRADQIDELKRALYADPTLTAEDREAAERQLEAMRPPRPSFATLAGMAARTVAGGLCTVEAPPDGPPPRSWPPTRLRRAVHGSFRPFMRKRECVFVGKERWAPHDKDAKGRIKAKIEAHTVATEPGRAWGAIPPKVRVVAEYLLDCVNPKDGRCFPSYKRIAAEVRRRTGGSCSVGTAVRAVKALVKIGVLEPFNRIKTIFEDVEDFFGGGKRERCVRTSNGYRFVDPDPDPEPAPQGAPAAQPVGKPVNCSNVDLRQRTFFQGRVSSLSCSFGPSTVENALATALRNALETVTGPQPAT
jgi:hypothetical protein